MRILADAVPLGAPPGPVSLAVGVFDGVHLGHRAVIQRTIEDARSAGGVAVVVTFDRHPSAVLAPASAPQMLLPLWRRLEAIGESGVEATLVFAFDEEFSRQPAAAFVERLVRGFGSVAGISVGAGFVFGHRRSGNLEVLRELGRRHGFAVHGVPPVTIAGEVVSSTRIRELVAAGDLGRAGALLGRAYTLAGEVVAGDRLGRQLGFPTANLDVPGLVLPPRGVYAAWARTAGRRLPAAVNIGVRPTVDGTAAVPRVEAHLLGFAGELYGARLELELASRLREERRFPSPAALRTAIGEDVAAVRSWAEKGGC